MRLPQLYRESILKDKRRRQRAEELQRMKLERVLRSEAEKEEKERKSNEERQRKLKAVIEAAKLRDQAKRNSARVQQEIAEMIAYEKQYGKVCDKTVQLPTGVSTDKFYVVFFSSLEGSWLYGIVSQMKSTTSK